MVYQSKHFSNARLILFNKPFNVLSQFTDSAGRATLHDYIPLTGVYPAGRLDRDSEGLLLLTDSGSLQARITQPRYKLPKTYWVQIEGLAQQDALAQLRQGVTLNDGRTRPAKVEQIAEPEQLWPRQPPVRYRKNIPTDWLQLTLSEGRNRQVRRMTAAVGLPTLRLIRIQIGSWSVTDLAPGEWQQLEIGVPYSKITPKKSGRLNRK